MLKRTHCYRIKPYLHSFSPGARPSEKGMLYRNGYMNAFARLSHISPPQRSARESHSMVILLIPDQLMMFFAFACTAVVALILSGRTQSFTINANKHSFCAGGLNEHELYKRTDDMTAIFEAHAEASANTRAEIELPPVYVVPEGWRSYSGTYPAEK